MTAVAVLIIMVALLGATVWLYERRFERSEATANAAIGLLNGDLERAQAENIALLRQIAGIDPTPEQIRTDMLEQLGGTFTAEQRAANTMGPGPLPQNPSRWEMPADDYYEDPTDLNAPLDQLPDSWTGIDAPQLAWNMDDQLAAPEPVPEGEFRPRIVGMSPGENPLEELGIEPVWRQE